MTEVAQLSLHKADAVQNHLDDSGSRHVVAGRRFRSREDEITFGRWRLGFLVFYGVLALILGGAAMVAADRPATFASAAKPTNPAIASADIAKHR